MGRYCALIILALTLGLLCSAPVAAVPAGVIFYPGASVRFERLSIDNGLSQNAGLALLQDSAGYLWIGTQDGLNRYDGYTFLQFKHDPENPASLSHNSVISLYEDRQGQLWVGTWGGGLNRYDPRSGGFQRFTADPANPQSLSNPVVTALAEDSQGRLWVGTLGGLQRFDPQTGQFVRFPGLADDPTTLSSDVISVILPAADGSFWIGTGAFGTPGAGLNRFDPQTGKARRFDPMLGCLQGAAIASLAQDGQGKLWIAYGGYSLPAGGLERFDPQTGECVHLSGSSRLLEDQNVTRLMIDAAGTLWGTTWGDGLWRMALEAPFTMIGYRSDPSDPDSLSSDSPFSLLQDRSGVIWIGTLNSGINKLNLDNLAFRHYKHHPVDPGSLSNNRVGAFAETSDGAIWVGTWESGLSRFDPRAGQFEHFRANPADPNSLSSDLVMMLYADPDDRLWVATLGGGLNYFDPQHGVLARYRNDPDDPSSLLNDQVFTLLRDTQQRLWVGSFAGLSRLEGERFVNYPLSTPPVSLYADDDSLWIGTWGGGLLQLDLTQPQNLHPATAQFVSLTHDPAQPTSLSDNNVWSIARSSGGLFWLASNAGLNRYDPDSGQFKTYTEKDGLQNATILGIVEDRQGMLWVTTNNGLAKFDPRSEQFRIYDKSDGLQGNEFNSNAYFRSPSSGEIYVGGGNGFNVFDPQAITDSGMPPSVVISDLKIFNESYPIDHETPIILNHDQDYLAFEFAALDFHAPSRNIYAYQLEGFDTGWIQAGTRRYASYTNLPGGTYTFRVKAANSHGIWSDHEATLRLTVTPPFWQGWEFRAGLGLGVLLLVASGVQWRIRAVREEARLLEVQVVQRTLELREANTRLASEVEQRKRAEDELARRSSAELHESQARFRAVFDNAAVGVAVMSLDRQIEQLSPTATRITGYTLEHIQRIELSSLVYEADRLLDRELFAELVAGKRDQYLAEKRYVRPDGSIFWGRINFALVRDTQGTPAYIIGIIEDITDARHTAERLAAQDAEYRRMLEQRIAERTAELNKANELLREKAAQDAVLAERTRLARDLHDAVTQTLFSAALIADVLPDLWSINNDEGKRRLAELRQLTRGALAEMRTLLVELRPNALVDVPLPVLLRQFCEALTGRARISIEFNATGERSLPPDVQVSLYRIAQEALNNVVKHARATHAVVTLRLADTVRLAIADNGSGFDPSTVTADHLGLKIMRERAEAIGAQLSIYSEAGEGTQISVTW